MPENTPPSKADIDGLRVAILGDPETGRIGLLDAVENLAKRDRNNKIVIGLALALVLLFGGGAYYFIDDNRDKAKATCEASNNRLLGTRKDKTEEHDLQVASAEAQNFPEGNPVHEYYDNLYRWRLDELYPLRDCDHLDEKFQVPGEPPSFDEALEEALRQQAEDDQ